MSNTSKRTLYLAIIFLLLIANIVIGYLWYNGSIQTEKLTVEKKELQEDYLTVQQDLNTQMAELEMMKGKNSSLDSIIVVRENELKTQQEKITKLFKQKNFNSNELKRAKGMISSLELQNSNFMSKIDSLISVTEELREANLGLNTELSSQIASNDDLQNKNKVLDDQNKILGNKVEIGSLLKANELNMVGIKIRSNGVERETSRIRRIEKIKVCYQTGINKVREPGEVKMHLAIITPSGKTLYNEANGSNIFKTKEGKEIRYTKEAAFDFSGNNKNVCIYWTQELSESGEYKAIMYTDGYKVGQTTMKFK